MIFKILLNAVKTHPICRVGYVTREAYINHKINLFQVMDIMDAINEYQNEYFKLRLN